MKPLDYLREAQKDCRKNFLPPWKKHLPELFQEYNKLLEQAQRSQKFVLPDGGRILDDNLKALPEFLQLPFPEIILEYHVKQTGTRPSASDMLFGEDATMQCPKRIVMAKQEAPERIRLNLISYKENKAGGGSWEIEPYVMFIHAEKEIYEKVKKQGTTRPLAHLPFQVINTNIKMTYELKPLGGIEKIKGSSWTAHAYGNLSEEVRPVLELIEALSCRNVSHEPLKRPSGLGAVKLGSAPYDQYRSLVVKVGDNEKMTLSGISQESRRSPREHLRCGHIRHYASGIKVWIQSTIVNPGSQGKITKSYQVKK